MRIKKIFLKEINQSNSLGYNYFYNTWEIEAGINLIPKAIKTNNDYISELTLMYEAISQDKKLKYQITMTYSLIIDINDDLNDDQIKEILFIDNMYQLFPYIKETFYSISHKTGGPLIEIQNTNFEELYFTTKDKLKVIDEST